MDLVVGARRVIVTMTATSSAGEPKVVAECTYPLTARAAVDVVITELVGVPHPRRRARADRAPRRGDGRGRPAVTTAPYVVDLEDDMDAETPLPTVVRHRAPGVDPPYDYPDYVGTRAARAEGAARACCPHTLTELTGPVYGDGASARSTTTSPASTRASRSASGSSSPAACSARTGGRCAASWSRSGRRTPPAATATRSTSTRAPLDPNFTGAGRALTDDEGRYRFVTIKPGAYPWGNHPNAWRPAHIHFSLFGRAFTERLVTQMYFPGDPLFAFDPIFNSVRDETRASG